MSLKNALETAKEILEAESMTMGVEAEMDKKSVVKKESRWWGHWSCRRRRWWRKNRWWCDPKVQPTGKSAPKPDMKPWLLMTRWLMILTKWTSLKRSMAPKKRCMVRRRIYVQARRRVCRVEEARRNWRWKNILDLFSGEELSRFKDKASTVFEAAVDTRVEEIREELSEEFEESLMRKKKHSLPNLTNISHMSLKWMKENQVAIDAGIKTDISELYWPRPLKIMSPCQMPSMICRRFEHKIDDVEANSTNQLKRILNFLRVRQSTGSTVRNCC